jgi:hypothetical protein
MSSFDETAEAVLVESQTRHILLISQSLFFLSLAWCLVLNHGPTAENDGISFYGVYHETAPVLIGGYAAAFVGLWLTSSHFKSAGVPTFTWIGLRIIAVLLFVLLATPYNRGAFLNWTHMTAGVAGSLLELEVALQLIRESRTFRTVLGLVVLVLGGAIAAASLPDWHFTYLLQGEIIFQAGFAWCLIEWTYALAARSKTT